jgi:hypothetical protein
VLAPHLQRELIPWRPQGRSLLQQQLLLLGSYWFRSESLRLTGKGFASLEGRWQAFSLGLALAPFTPGLKLGLQRL